MYHQSIKSIKHNAARSVLKKNRPIGIGLLQFNPSTVQMYADSVVTSNKCVIFVLKINGFTIGKYCVKKHVIIYFSGICMYISNSNTILALNSAYAHRKQQTVCTYCIVKY